MRILIYGPLVLALALVSTEVLASQMIYTQGDKLDDEPRAGVTRFLNTNSELRKYNEVRFTGMFPPIPVELRSQLAESFPQFTFLLARMESRLHVSPVPLDLIVITDSQTGRVVGYVWDFSWALPSASFGRLLVGQRAESKKDALRRIEVLGRLIVYTDQGSVKSVTIKNHKIAATLLRDGSAQPFRILKVDLDKQLKFGEMTLAVPRRD